MEILLGLLGVSAIGGGFLGYKKLTKNSYQEGFEHGYKEGYENAKREYKKFPIREKGKIVGWSNWKEAPDEK